VWRIKQHLRDIGADGNVPQSYEIVAQTFENHEYRVCVSRSDKFTVFDLGTAGQSTEYLIDVTVNGIRGHGIVEFMYRAKNARLTMIKPEKTTAMPDMVIALTDTNACNALFVGSKAAQLAILTRASKVRFGTPQQPQPQQQQKSRTIDGISAGLGQTLVVDPKIDNHDLCRFEVPAGFCLSISAHQVFEEHVRATNAEYQQLLQQLQQHQSPSSSSSSESSESSESSKSSKSSTSPRHYTVGELCERLRNSCLNTSMPDNIRQQIARAYLEQLGDDSVVAVRSSALAEDTGASSAAGQFETVLGVSGVDGVVEAIRQCWASQFLERSVSYRLANSIALSTPMAVVVQRLVRARASGVCFTANPITSNQSNVVVAANFGLGVTVVDGNVVPDHFSLIRRLDHADSGSVAQCTWRFDVESVESSASNKHQYAEYDEQSRAVHVRDASTTASTDSSHASTCITEQQAKRVAAAASASSWFFGGTPRDVEWSFDSDERLYLLQSRPITSVNNSYQSDDGEWATYNATEAIANEPSRTSVNESSNNNPNNNLNNSLNNNPNNNLNNNPNNNLNTTTTTTDNEQSHDTVQIAQLGHELLAREFDSALASDQWLTTVNIGEMIPGALTPLTMSVFVPAIDYALQYMANQSEIATYYPRFVAVIRRHAFLNLMQLGSSYVKSFHGDKRAMELALAGRLLTEVNERQVQEYHCGVAPLSARIAATLSFVHKMLCASKLVDVHQQVFDSGFDMVSLAVEQQLDAAQTYRLISFLLPVHLYHAWRDTVLESARSGSWSSILMSILAGKNNVWSQEHYGDLSMLLAQCDGVMSAEVAPQLNAIAREIYRIDPSGSKFIAGSAQQALEWLQSPASAAAGHIFAALLRRHGHRCIREAELREPSWAAAPIKLIPVIREIVRQTQSPSSEATTMPSPPPTTTTTSTTTTTTPQTSNVKPLSSIHKGVDAIEFLTTPLTFGKKMALKYLVPLARAAVGKREYGKSIAIQMQNEFKRAYCHLADLLVQQSLLPEADLIYFLSHDELAHLLKPGPASRALVAHASKRREVHDRLAKLVFPVLNKQLPRPLSPESLAASSSSSNSRTASRSSVDATRHASDQVVDLEMVGMPVSRGVVRGRVRVATSVQEAADMQKGEILIVPYTDIGWTVYFPLAAGLATELGGLLSHGAVCAREYGIPCIVNLAGACTHFQTGDWVEMNGHSGSLKRIAPTHQ
jgi:phosphohistidine swiveling domain-containing protein